MFADRRVDPRKAVGKQQLLCGLRRIERESVGREWKLLHKCAAGDSQAKCTARLQHAPDLSELYARVFPKVKGIDGKYVINRLIRERDSQPICPFETYPPRADVMFVDFAGLFNHRFGPIHAVVPNAVALG